jgi:hypothetical protein
MAKVKEWRTISDASRSYFSHVGDWMNHFSKEVIDEAQEFYAASLQEGEWGRGAAGEAAWNYALGASRFMQKPATDVLDPA